MSEMNSKSNVLFYDLRNRRLNTRKRQQSTDTTIKNTYSSDIYQYGLMYLDVWFGAPSQRVTLALSLTSDLTVVPCDDVCGNDCEGNPYLSSSSSTFSNITCDQCSSYYSSPECDATNQHCLTHGSFLDGSLLWEGVLSSDMAYFGGAAVEGTPNVAQDYGIRYIFACQTQYNSEDVISRWVKRRAHGIISFSPSEQSMMKQLYKSQVIHSPNFAVCFYSKKEDKSHVSGLLQLSNYVLATDSESSELYGLHSYFTPKYYAVVVQNLFLSVRDNNENENIHMVLNANDLNNEQYDGVIIDTGSPASFLSSDIFGDSLKYIWEQVTGNKFPEDGGSFLPSDIPSLPTFKIQFKSAETSDEGTTRRKKRTFRRNLSIDPTVGKLDSQNPNDFLLTVTPDEYLDFNQDTLSYHMGIFLVPSTELSIIGANLLRKHLVYFDLEQQQISIAAQTTCSRAKNVSNKNETASNTNETPTTTTTKQSLNSSSFAPTNAPLLVDSTIGNSPTSEPVLKTENTLTNTNENNNPVDEDYDTMSFSIDLYYYIATAALGVLFLILAIFNLVRFTQKRNRRRMM